MWLEQQLQKEVEMVQTEQLIWITQQILHILMCISQHLSSITVTNLENKSMNKLVEKVKQLMARSILLQMLNNNNCTNNYQNQAQTWIQMKEKELLKKARMLEVELKEKEHIHQEHQDSPPL